MTKPSKNIADYFEFPNKSMRNKYKITREDVWLAGFYSENISVCGYLNFVLSDGNYTTPVTNQIRYIMPEKCKSPKYVRVHLSNRQKSIKGIAYLDN